MDCLRYYLITAKCGHVGRSKYIPITFPVIACSKKEAASLTRQFPRVKHNHKDAIINAVEVTYEEYRKKYFENKKDGYLLAKNNYQQNIYCDDLYYRLIDDEHNVYKVYDKEKRFQRIKYKTKKENLIKKQLLKYDSYFCVA